MKIGLSDHDESHVKGRKRKKPAKTARQTALNNVDMDKINGDTQEMDKSNDKYMHKKRVVCSGNGVASKRKKLNHEATLPDNETSKILPDKDSKEKVVEKPQESMEPAERTLVKENNAESDTEVKDEKITNKQLEQLSGKYLRTSFTSTNTKNVLDTLKIFVKVCNENAEKDLAAEYLDAGGNILEVLRILGSLDQKNIGTATDVFSAIRILLMKILGQYPQYQSTAEEACRHLINSNLSLIHSMLSLQSNTKQRKIILRLLAAIVSLGGNLPRELLVHLSLSPQVIGSLLQHSKYRDNESVRTCFIHFVLAFLVEGSVPAVRALLEKHSLLSCIFSDLLYDSKEIINLVLTTVKTYVLENSGISKTMKMHVFSTSVIQNIMNLYNWKGSNNWSKSKTCGIGTKDPKFLAEKKIVTDTVHNFLITLLTSHRYGIVFHDCTLGTSSDKHNQLVQTVLQSLNKPWEHDKPSNLLLKVMVACPDLIKIQLALMESYMKPKVSSNWITLMMFLQKLIQSVDIKACLKIGSTELSNSSLAGAIVPLIAPGIIFKNAIIPSLLHDSIVVRHQAIKVLTTIFKQLQEFIWTIKRTYDEDDCYDVFKDHMVEYITKNAPNLDMILYVWSKPFESNIFSEEKVEDENIEQPVVHEHLNAILNFLNIFGNVSPLLLHAVSQMQLNTLLDTLDKFNGTDGFEYKEVKMKAIYFLVHLDPTEFTPDKEIFRSIFPFLILLFNEEKPEISECAKTTVRTILNTTTLFDGCHDQLDIWVNGFLNVSGSKEEEKILDWFVYIIKTATEDKDIYVNTIQKAEDDVFDQVLRTTKLEDVLLDIINVPIIYDTLERPTFHLQNHTCISPLLCCLLDKANEFKDPSLLPFLSYILMHTLHCQVTPQCLVHLTKDIPKLPIRKYLTCWVQKDQPVHIKTIYPYLKATSKLSAALLVSTKIDLNKVFKGDIICTFQFDGEEVTVYHSLTIYEILCLFRMTIFYLCQFNVKMGLSEIVLNNCKIVLIMLLHVINQSLDKRLLMIEKCAMYIFAQPSILQYYSIMTKRADSPKNLMAQLIFDLGSVLSVLSTVTKDGNIFVHFKNKTMRQLYKMIAQKYKYTSLKTPETSIALLLLLQPSPAEILKLLTDWVQLKTDMFFCKKKLSFHGHLVPALLELTCSERLKHMRAAFFKLQLPFIKSLCDHLLILKINNVTNSDIWEVALCKYFSHFPFNIAGVDMKTFSSLLSTKFSNATVKLISLLINRSTAFLPLFMEYMKTSEYLRAGNIIFPILESNLTHGWNRKFLQTLSKQYEKEIVECVIDPQKVSGFKKENVNAICYLIEKTFNLTTCEETCNMTLEIGDKMEMVSYQYIKLLESIFYKYTTLDPDSEKPLKNFLLVFLHITTITLKKEPKNEEKLGILCQSLINAARCLQSKKDDFVFESLRRSNSWAQYTRFSLKLGFKEIKNKRSILILKALNILCDIAYIKDSDNESAKTLFEMTTSHSEFVNIMLESSETKRYIIELLWILMQKNKTVMTSTHVALYLAAYNATLSETDQLILLILQYYEKNNVSIHEYRPYLWGNAAALHYSVKGDADMALWRQPTISQVLDLFEMEFVKKTLKMFPLNRALKNTKLSEADDVYDPAFYLPLLCFLLNENNIVSCHKVTQSGVLALTFAACSSLHSDIRLAAYTIIPRFYTHLEASSSKAKLLWMRLIDALRNGIVTATESLVEVRLSFLVSTFLAQTSIVFTQPLHPLYSRLQAFLMAKPALDIKAIPEVLQLLHSPDVDHKAHRHWILKNLRDGIKTESDVDLFFKYVIFKMLLDFYTSNLSDSEAKSIILEVVHAATKIPKGATILMFGHGLLPWLLGVIHHMQNDNTYHLVLLIKIIGNLTNVALSSKEESSQYRFILVTMLIMLKRYLSKNIEIASFTLYLEIFLKLITSEHVKAIVPKEAIVDIVLISRILLGNVNECEDMIYYGCQTITLIDSPNNEVEIAKNVLKDLVWTWSKDQK